MTRRRKGSVLPMNYSPATALQRNRDRGRSLPLHGNGGKVEEGRGECECRRQPMNPCSASRAAPSARLESPSQLTQAARARPGERTIISDRKAELKYGRARYFFDLGQAPNVITVSAGNRARRRVGDGFILQTHDLTKQ